MDFRQLLCGGESDAFRLGKEVFIAESQKELTSRIGRVL